MTVILVDDEKLALEGLLDAVKSVLLDADIHCFSIAREAIEYANSTQVDIAFLDIHMRGIDGIEVAKQLLEHYPKTNVIFCTGFTDYALDAFDVYCSGYLMKPISSKKVLEAVSHLRYPIELNRPQLSCQCFGNFEIFCNGTPVHFKHKKTKELLAYLVDRNGTDVSTKEISAAIFESDDKQSYFDHLRVDLIKTFEELGVAEFIRKGWGTLGVERSMIDCDYYKYLDGKDVNFNGEYMNQYSWAEYKCSTFEKR